MPFTPIAAGQIDLLQNAVDGDVFIPSFSRRSFLQGATAGLLSLAPALTMVGNLLTVDAPVRNYSLATFAGLGLSIETTVVAGNFPVVASRDVQVNNVASTGHTYTYPTSRRVGQLLVMAVATAALTTITTPSGWTLVQSQAGTESRTSIFTRVLDGLEPSTELLAFGTASGAVVRTWMIDIGDAPVEAVAGINDSAAGTSLDLATISPTWAAAEATSTLYIAVLGLANDVTVSGFPAGYTVTGQDASVSGTANVDCALAYAERSALGSSENPGAFTYAASRSTGHILAIKPKVTARLNWDGLTVRKNSGADVGTRRRVNLIEGTGVTLTVADDGTEIDVTIAAASGSAHTLRDDGVDMTQRAAANFVSSTTITAILTDDAGNNETEITFQLGAFTGGDVTSAANSLVLTIANNAVTNAKLADMAANTLKANATGSSADPADFAVTSEGVVGRTSGNITNIASAVQTAFIRAAGSLFFASAAADQVLRRSGSGDLGFGTLVTGNIGNSQVTLAKIQNVADDTMLVNISGVSGPLVERALADMAGDGLIYDAANHHWDVNGSTSIIVTSDQVQRAGLTGAIAAAQNSNSTVFSGIRNNGGATTDRANLNFISSSTLQATLTDDAGNDEIEIAYSILSDAVSNTLLSNMAANTIKANPTGSSADPQDLAIAGDAFPARVGGNLVSHPFSSLAGSGMSYAAGVLTIGAGNDVQVNATTVALAPFVELEVATTGTIASQARTGGARHIMYTGAADTTVDNIAAGSYRGQIIVVSGQNGRVVLPDNAGATAAERIANPDNVNVIIGDEDFVPFIYLDDSAASDAPRWCNLKHTAPFVNTTANLAGDVIVHNGSNWIIAHNHFDEEFYGTPGSFMSASALVGAWNWASNGNGVYQTLISEASHPGIVQLNTTGTSGDTLRAALGGTIGTDGTDFASQLVLGDIAFFRFIVRIPSDSSLTSANYGIGFAQTITNAEIQGTTPNLGGNGLIMHKNTGSALWVMRRETASAAVIANSPRNAALSDWIECVGINNGGGSWSFTMNGVAFSASLTGVSTSALVRPVFFLHQTAAGTRKLDIDKFEFATRFQASRFTP